MLQLDFVTYRIPAILKVVCYSLWFLQPWHVQNCNNNFKMNLAFSVTHLKQKLQIVCVIFCLDTCCVIRIVFFILLRFSRDMFKV